MGETRSYLEDDHVPEQMHRTRTWFIQTWPWFIVQTIINKSIQSRQNKDNNYMYGEQQERKETRGRNTNQANGDSKITKSPQIRPKRCITGDDGYGKIEEGTGKSD